MNSDQFETGIPAPQGLYDFEQERDACGVGLVADLKNEPSHKIIEMGITVLKRLMHRGAVGSDPDTGDGAGILLALPDEFFRLVLPNKLPARGKYGVAMMFGGCGHEEELEAAVTENGGSVIAWRQVPVDRDSIGKNAQRTCPLIRQLFIDGSGFADQAEFERKLFVMRREMERRVEGCYVCSCSSRSIVYKGLFLGTQIEGFYGDLASEHFKSPLALVHQRYSTNTFPTWSLAHPFRYLAHNGEINTLRGNLNHLSVREPHLSSTLLGDDLQKLLPLIPPGQSDSACLDNMVELLAAAGRDLRHVMLMLMPQAWGVNYHLGPDVRGFFEYHSAMMEPWDGPTAVVFSDGINAGAMLDRNGLRPARYTLTTDDIFILASETGVADIPAEKVARKGRLRPGEMIYCDLVNHRLVSDAETKNEMARRMPYRRWVEKNKISVRSLFDSISASAEMPDLVGRQRQFGFTQEDVELIIRPMMLKGAEPLGSMGNDAPLAVLSGKAPLLFNYFKQLFAQVTNPPIDPIREELVMSLTTYIGNHPNILEETPEHARLIKMARPVITDEELNRLCNIREAGFPSARLPLQFPEGGDGKALRETLESLAESAVGLVRSGVRILVLTDRNIGNGYLPVPSLLACSVVNRALASAGLRSDVGLILETGEARETMHFALLLGFGATAVNPYLALATVTSLAAPQDCPLDVVKASGNYINAIDKGLLKIMSKMGISTLRSYRSSQLFEAVGLNRELIDEFFPGTVSRVGGIGLDEIAVECNQRAAQHAEHGDKLDAGGQYKYKKGGENHLWNPQTLQAFRAAVRDNDERKYREFADYSNRQAQHLCTLRGLFEFAPADAIPLEEVESVDSILRRFVSGAMSLGSLSPEAHETIAIAMNKIGAKSNSGEGGEDEARYEPNARGEVRYSAIKQVASGRFGVTINYLRHASELQIKMAQGAKPGEGGQLPAHKVDPYIARLRHSMPNVSLISPPPHHDIYSIEDLAQLIYDLRNSNPDARVSVKLVSEVGIGAVAAGVVKAHADVVVVSGHDGGTGASPLTSVKHAGLPWELGLAETQQTLVLNKLRSRVRLQVDGQLRTGRDVVMAALLGAEEFGFGTAILISIGCAMLRRCHENTCPVGVATQDPALRAKFSGKPEYVINYLRFVARETREILASLGLRSLDEAVGRADLLSVNRAIDFYKARHLDFSSILHAAEGDGRRFDPSFKKEPLDNYDRRHLLPALKPLLEKGEKMELCRDVLNVDRTVGTELSGELVMKFGPRGLAEDTLTVHFTGCAGQSFGAFLAPGVTFELVGEANDFVGKGLSGGKIIVLPPDHISYVPSDNVIAGNVIGYGATSGSIFLHGQAGERFAIRNSGAKMVVEGIGDHGCEYMTGGRVAVLGKVGVNFAAGMTGGLAYVYDADNNFDQKCNLGSVDLETVMPHSADEAELLQLIYEHYMATRSRRAYDLLNNWPEERGKFIKVFPVEYRHALHGQAGERFAIRNSGAKMVVEGIGDHGCEYMTGGRVAVLGKVGVNFAAGMTGGLAYVYDADNNFDQKCNLGSVDLETVMPHSADEAELLQLIYEHYMATRSRRAYDLLNNWPEERGKFIKVFPVEYRHALAMHS